MDREKRDQPRIAVVGIPGKWSTEVLADAVEAKTGFRLVVDLSELVIDLGGRRCRYRDFDLCQLDGLIVKKVNSRYCPQTLDRLEMLRMVEQSGVKIFSRPQQIINLVNRLSCTITLSNHAIPMPETVITESVDAAEDAVREFGQAVFKPLYSSKARGMSVIDSRDKPRFVRQEVERFKESNPVMYIQKKIDLPGRDLGLIFLGGEYLGAYARVTKGSWNTTINSGGRYASYEASAEMVEIAHRAQALFGMDFTTVDVAETENGPVVFEVSAFGGFRGAKEGCGIDAAAMYADYVLARL